MNSQEQRLTEGILFTDQYQLTMAQLYFRTGIHERPSQFDYFFRKNPDYGSHQAGFCINAGLAWLLDWLGRSRFTDFELGHLRRQQRSDGNPLFAEDFLDWLRENGNFASINLRAIPEGRVVHPNVPLAVVNGPLAMVQILESSLLNHLNYQTLIATKAARVHDSGQGQLVLEFGMRRAHDGGANAGVRGALIGGADFSSNVGISLALGYPPKGTHAHSMVQVFMALAGGELDAFQAYADVYPDDCLLLVDTVNTLESGIPNALKVFERLRRQGHKPLGIRLDSGDLAYLSIQAAAMLNNAGFPEAKIVLSNQLDELIIWQIITQIQLEAARYGVDADHLIRRLVFGVGTGLITSKGASALDGVYKLVAVRQKDKWLPAIKISESQAKTLNPGDKQVWRLYDERGKATADLVCLADEQPEDLKTIVLCHPTDHSKRRSIERSRLSGLESLLIEILRDGRLQTELPALENIRRRRRHDIERLDAGVKRLVNPHIYHVSLSERLWNLKQKLIARAIGGT